MFLFAQRNRFILPIGAWLNDNSLELVWFDDNNAIQAAFIELAELSNLNQLLAQRMSYRKVNYQFIGAILPQHIWSKTLILPHTLTVQECEQQCRYTLQDELPIPVEQVYYDYRYKLLSTNVQDQPTSRLDILALSKKSVQQYSICLNPLKFEVLDHIIYALLRAFYYFYPELDDEPEVLWIYKDSEQCIAFQNLLHELRIVQLSGTDLIQLKANFCQRYTDFPKRCIIYTSEKLNYLPEQWEELQTDIPLIALGCALWAKSNKENKETINLLPWRLTQHQQRLRYFFQTLSVLLLFGISCGFLFSYLTQGVVQIQQLNEMNNQHLQMQLSHLHQKIEQQKQTVRQNTDVNTITPYIMTNVISMLSRLPFEQSELFSLNLQFQQQQLIIELQGIAENNNEFERLHHFLHHQNWLSSSQLLHFEPRSDQRLSFQFQLTVQE